MSAMTRREFGSGAAAAAVLLAAGSAPRAEVADEPPRADGPAGPPLEREEERMLALASLAPSGHNTQPWAVVVAARDRWTVGVDPTRRLPGVDPDDRETVISLGTFLENLTAAAPAVGREAAVEVLSARRDDPALYQVHLARRRPEDDGTVARIERRRTLRADFRDDRLTQADRDALLAAGGGVAFFPAGTREAGWLRDAAVESFRAQSQRDDAQAELQRWIRFDAAEVRAKRDGMNSRTMELGLLARLWMEHFMGASAVTTRDFRRRGVELTAEQARRGAGFLVLWSRDESVPALLDVGRRWERLALRLRERRLAMHPMSQVLEERDWRIRLRSELGVDGVPQGVLRVGYRDDLPLPVSPRRPPRAFTTFG